MATVIPLYASSPSPNLSVAISSPNISTNGAFDTITYVNVPASTTNSLQLYNLLSAFVLTNFTISLTDPTGAVASQQFVSCFTTNYPTRNAITTCVPIAAPQLVNRVVARAYSGSTTGIFVIGFANLSPPGFYSFTYYVTGLFEGNTITLTSNFQIKVSDPPCCPAGPFTIV